MSMKIDLHLHSNASPDSILKLESAFKIAKKKGLQGIALTDHNTSRKWPEAKRIAGELKMQFIQGEEIMVRKNGKKFFEIIGLFMNDEIKQSENHFEVFDALKQQDAIGIIAHPFDELRTEFKQLDEIKNMIQGMETFNSRCIFKKYNEKALHYALKNNLTQTGGSDSHTEIEVGNAWTLADCNELEEFRTALKKKATIGQGRKSNPLVHAVSVVKKRVIKLFR